MRVRGVGVLVSYVVFNFGEVWFLFVLVFAWFGCFALFGGFCLCGFPIRRSSFSFVVLLDCLHGLRLDLRV